MFTIKEILTVAVKVEKNGEDYYREALEKTARTPMGRLFEFLADEEKRHRLWFLEQSEKLVCSADGGQLGEMDEALIESLLQTKAFSLDDIDLVGLTVPQSLLETAIEFENDTILFYEMISEFINEKDTVEQLRDIIAEERGHCKLIQEFFEKSSKGKAAENQR
ncbi:MAG: ferritin family protein [Deltaproteobacteria bacterium]|nr:ferritin family protein [Deltaproteobacteria bacterium]